MNPRTFLRPAGWLACLAMVMMAVAPSFTHLLAARIASTRVSTAWWVPLCGAEGVADLAAVQGGVDPDDPGLRDRQPGAPSPRHAGVDHCPFCSMHGGAMPPVERAGLVASVDRTHGAPMGGQASPIAARAWAAVLPRAPPEGS